MVVKRVRVLSAAIVCALIYGAVGLVVWLSWMSLLWWGAGMAMTADPGTHSSTWLTSLMMMGLATSWTTPFTYAVKGALFGAVGAMLYNLLTPLVGGLEVELG